MSKKNKKQENKNKIVEVENNHSFLNIIIFFLLLLIGIILYARYYTPKTLIVKETRIISKNLTKNFSGIKIAHFGDINYGNTTFTNEIKNLVKRINEYKPDIIIFSGNLISNNYNINTKQKKELLEELNKLESNLGKYAVKGNNDYNKFFDEIIKKTNFKLLNNEYELIFKDNTIPMFIGGTESSSKKIIDYDKIFDYFKNNNNINLQTPIFKIIVTHEGNNINDILNKKKDINLILSGHSLNGSVIIPNYGGIFIPKESSKYYLPYYKKGNTDIFITSGIGTDKYKLRYFNRPSFNLYRLKSI